MGSSKGMDWVLLAVDNMAKLEPELPIPTLWKRSLAGRQRRRSVRHLPLFSNALLTLRRGRRGATASR